MKKNILEAVNERLRPMPDDEAVVFRELMIRTEILIEAAKRVLGHIDYSTEKYPAGYEGDPMNIIKDAKILDAAIFGITQEREE